MESIMELGFKKPMNATFAYFIVILRTSDQNM